ncbi:hypothetical protein A4G20_09580 [Pasteurellaceae bacterium RH1A]|nr:hypothetical protein A4G20_09580 [Pasteurellaceae bacterium RH1A]
MPEFLLSFPALFASQAGQLLMMFASSFLSATLIPANSEIIFSTLASPHLLQKNWQDLAWLWLVASLGNTLGGMTTYYVGRFFPSPQITTQTKPTVRWSLKTLNRYGNLALLLSWVPLVGDLLCGLAGWLRLDAKAALVAMFLGKAGRYAVLAYSLSLFL